LEGKVGKEAEVMLMANDNMPAHSLQSESLRSFYRQRGFAGRVGFGVSPAVLVIDLAKAWTDPTSQLGSDLSSVIGATNRLLDVARRMAVPVFFTTMAFEPGLIDCGEVVMRKKPHSEILIRGSEWVKIHPALNVRPNEVLIVKQRASAFFGTTLLSQLTARRVDTLIITGCSTSGCVRATAQGAHDNNLHTIVPREAVGDRSPAAHEANLFDIDARMGDVVSIEDVVNYLEHLKEARDRVRA
jgi:nicotinamidase-related amidase